MDTLHSSFSEDLFPSVSITTRDTFQSQPATAEPGSCITACSGFVRSIASSIDIISRKQVLRCLDSFFVCFTQVQQVFGDRDHAEAYLCIFSCGYAQRSPRRLAIMQSMFFLYSSQSFIVTFILADPTACLLLFEERPCAQFGVPVLLIRSLAQNVPQHR